MQIETYLEHNSFVRGLAHSLIFDGNVVDDVIQETWVRALTTRPQEVRSWKPWLSRVVRNLTVDRYRSSKRTREREKAAANPEALPSTAELASQESMRHEVAEAALGLAEPYRTAILLRYFEEMSPNQISTRLKVPVGTVQTRLKRGLDQLRTILDEKHSGNRRAWGLSLIPLALPKAKGSAIAVGGFISAAAIILALLGTFFFVFRSSASEASVQTASLKPNPPSLENPETKILGTQNLGPNPEPPSTPKQRERQIPSPEKPLGAVKTCMRIRGQVLNSLGQPISDAKVTLKGTGKFVPNIPDLDESTGTITLSTTPDSQTALISDVDRARGKSKSTFTLDYLVVDVSADGSFDLKLDSWPPKTTGLGSYDQWSISATAEGYCTSFPQALSTDSFDQNFELQLEAGIKISGRILDENTHEPIEGAKIFCTHSKYMTQKSIFAISDENGAFHFPSAIPREAVTIRYSKAGYRSKGTLSAPDPDSKETVLELMLKKSASTLYGTVEVSGNRECFPNVSAFKSDPTENFEKYGVLMTSMQAISTSSQSMRIADSTSSDPNLTYEFSLEVGESAETVWVAAFCGKTYAVKAVARGAKDIRLSLFAPSENDINEKIQVHVKATDALTGKPVARPSASLYPYKWDEKDFEQYSTTRLASDNNSETVLEMLPFGKAFLQVTASGYGYQFVEDIWLLPGENPLSYSVALPKEARVEGKLKFGKYSSRELGNITASVCEATGSKRFVGVYEHISANGSFILDSLNTDKYMVSFYSTQLGKDSKPIEFSAVSGSTTQIEVPLEFE